MWWCDVVWWCFWLDDYGVILWGVLLVLVWLIEIIITEIINRDQVARGQHFFTFDHEREHQQRDGSTKKHTIKHTQ